MKAEEYRRERIDVEGWPVNLTSYRIGDLYHATTDNVSPGSVVSRASAATREEAERKAVEEAREKLSRARRMAV